MRHSDNLSVLVERLAEFQKKIRPLDKKNRARGKNGEFYSYAPIDDILKHIRLPLAKHGLFIQQTVTGDIGVTTTLIEVSSRAWIADTALVTVNGPIEQKGAAITQLRRYSLITMLGLPTVEPEAKQMNEVERLLADFSPGEQIVIINKGIHAHYVFAEKTPAR